MIPSTEQIMKGLVFYNDLLTQEEKRYFNSLIQETWEKIPHVHQSKLLNSLEFIIIKPIEDPLYPGTVALTRKSATMPLKNWIIWNPFSIRSLQDQSKIFLLAHEFAHSYLQHPQKEVNKNIAEDEANHQTISNWHITPSENDRVLFFSNLDY